MSVAISLSEEGFPSPPAKPFPVQGVGRVAFHHRAGETRLSDLYQHDPVRILFPDPPRGEIPSAVFVTTSGGLVGGDEISLSATAHKDTAVQCLPQAAEKIYRSTGAVSRIDVSLKAEGGAWLEWLPQETIVFNDARFSRKTRADVAEDSRLLAGEFVVLGRTAMGETVKSGLIRDDWEIHCDGRLIWADALCLDGDISMLREHPAALDGATALATAIYVAKDASAALETARALLADAPVNVRVGVTQVNGVLLARFLSPDTQALRQVFADYWAGMRAELAGLPARLPRLWHI